MDQSNAAGLLAKPATPPAQPPPRPAAAWKLGAIVLLLGGYAALSHYSNSAPEAKGLATGLSIGPPLLIGALLLWRWSHPLLAATLSIVSCFLLFHYWSVLTRYYEWSDVFQQGAIYTLLSASFARSLFGGRVPLCTQLSVQLNGPLEPREVLYTRRATIAWSVFYGLLAAVILVLFFVASLRIWSLFVNFVTFGLIGLMFLVDHAVRWRLLPRRPGGILAAVRQSLGASR